MAIKPKVDGLDSIVNGVLEDPGLPANIIQADIDGGAAAATKMNKIFMSVIDDLGVNSDGMITPEELEQVSDAIRADPKLYAKFVKGHGDDEGNVETGFHLVQGDGGAFRFQGRDFIDTVADAIYHIGFIYENGRFVNEDGNANETVSDVAGWLNYFLNGKNIVYGSAAGETLNSGHYSFALAAAANELFLAGDGDDRIWAGDGNDIVKGGKGNDQSGGGEGNDRMYGGEGNDSFGGDEGNDKIWGGKGEDRVYGEEGNDILYGGLGDDHMGGGEGRDEMHGGDGIDRIWGDEGRDKLYGDDGDDQMGGGRGNDKLWGGDGNDKIGGDEGSDKANGGKGDDTIYLGTGNDHGIGGRGSDTMHGNEGNDLLEGGISHDTIYGGDGKDQLFGNSGNDKLHGQDGNDKLNGGSGNDEMSGGEGADLYIGGKGADKMTAWDDDDATDTFKFFAGDSGITSNTMDTIAGFTSGQDKIDLSAFVGMQYGENSLIGGGQSSVGYDGDFLLIDIDGDGSSDMMVELLYVNDVVAGDFILA